MAKVSEYSRYQLLKDLIEKAIEDAIYGVYEDDEDPNEIVLAISPELDEVDCIVDPSSFEEMDFIRLHDGWHIDSATNYEDAIEVAQNYFDLR